MPRAELNIVARMTDLASNQIQRLRGEVWMLSRVTNSSTGVISRYDAALSGLMAGGILMAVSRGVFSFVEANNALNETLIRTRNNTAMATEAVGKTVVSFDEYRTAVMEISDQVGAGADTIAEGFQHAYNYAEDMTIAIAETTMGAKSARANYADLEKTVDLLASVMHQYGADVLPETMTATEKMAEANKRAALYMGILDRAAAMGNMTVEEFVKAAGRAFGAAARLNIPLDQTAAAYTALTKRGFNAAQAQTQLTNVITKAANPTRDQRKFILQLTRATGVDLVKAYSAAGLSQYGLLGVIDMTREAFKRMGYTQAEATQAAYKLINAQRGGQALAVLTTLGYEDMTDALAVLRDTEQMAATTEKQFADATQFLAFNLQTVRTIVDNVGKEIGDGMSPALNEILKVITPILRAFGEFVRNNKTLVGTIAVIVGAFTGLLGVLMTVGATMILLAPILHSAGRAFQFMTGASEEADVGMRRQASAAVLLSASEARLAAAAKMQAAAEATRGAATRAGAEAFRFANQSISGYLRSLEIAGGALSRVSAAIKIKTKEVKGLTQAEIDESSIAKTVALERAAETQATAISAQATKSFALAQKELAEASKLQAIGQNQAAAAANFAALASRGGRTAAMNAAKATYAHQRSVLAFEAAALKAAAASAVQEAALLQVAAAERAEIAAARAREAATNAALTAEQRAALIEEARTAALESQNLATQAAVKYQQALVASDRAAIKTRQAMAVGTSALASLTRAFNRILAESTVLQGAYARATAAIGAASRIASTAVAAVTATLRVAQAAYTRLIVTLQGVQVAVIGVSRTVMGVIRVLAAMGAMLRTVVGLLAGFGRAATVAFATLAKTSLTLYRALIAVVEAAGAAGRWLASAAKSSWAFVSGSRAGAKAAQTQALAMNELALATGRAGASTRGVIGILGAAASKLLGVGLIAMIVYDMWSSNFLGLKDLTTKVFGGIVENFTKVTDAADAFTIKMGKALKKGGSWTGSWTNKDGQKITDTIRDIGDAYEKTTTIVDKSGKQISKTVTRQSKDITKGAEKSTSAMTTMQGAIGSVAGFINARFTELGGTFKRVRDWFGELFAGGTAQTLKRFMNTLEKAIGPKTANTFIKAVYKIRDAWDSLFGNLKAGAGKVADVLHQIGNILDDVFGGRWTMAIVEMTTLVRDLFGPEVAADFERTMADIRGGIDKAIAYIKGKIENFSEALGKLLDTGDLGQFFRDIWPTESEWANIWTEVQLAAQRTFRFVVNVGATVLNWAKGLFESIPWGTIWTNFKNAASSAWNFGTGVIKDVWGFLFGKTVKLDSAGAKNITTWEQGVVEKIWNGLKDAVADGIEKGRKIVSDIWTFLFGGEVMNADETTYSWSEGVVSKLWRALQSAVTTYGPKIGAVITDVWGFLFGKQEQGTDAGQKGTNSWSQGVIAKLVENLKTAVANLPWGDIWASAKQITSDVLVAAIKIVDAVTGWLADQWNKVEWDKVWAAAKDVITKDLPDIAAKIKDWLQDNVNRAKRITVPSENFEFPPSTKPTVAELPLGDQLTITQPYEQGREAGKNFWKGIADFINNPSPPPSISVDLGPFGASFNRELDKYGASFNETVKAFETARGFIMEGLAQYGEQWAIQADITKTQVSGTWTSITTAINTETAKWGQALSDEAAKWGPLLGGGLDTAWAWITTNWDAAKKFSESLAPYANGSKLTEALTPFFDGLKKDWETGVAALGLNIDISGMLAKVGTDIEVFRVLKWIPFWASIGQTVNGTILDIKTAWENSDIGKAVSTFTKLIEDGFTTLKEILVGKSIVPETVAAIQKCWDDLVAPLTTTVNNIKKVIEDAWNGAKSTVETAVNNLRDAVMNAFNWVKDKVGGPIDTTKGYIDGLVAKISGAIADVNSLIGKLGNIKMPPILNTIWNKIVEIKNSLPSIGGSTDQRAAGGLSPGGMTLVGERGPEYVRLTKGDRVYMASQTRALQRQQGPQVNNYFSLTQNVQAPVPTPIQGFQALRAWARA